MIRACIIIPLVYYMLMLVVASIRTLKNKYMDTNMQGMDVFMRERRVWLDKVQLAYRNKKANRTLAIIFLTVTLGYFLAHIIAFFVIY